MRNADMPAAPLSGDSIRPLYKQDQEFIEQCNGAIGLTKREHFAAMAMQGIIASLDKAVPEDELAREAVTAADALLKALEES